MRDKICGVPFSELAIHPKKTDEYLLSAIPCCSSWLKPPYSQFSIEVKEDPSGKIDIAGAWNSPLYIAFRESILSGSYQYCRPDVCPYFTLGDFPPLPEEALPYIEKKETYLNYPPITINVAIDRACNLSCPSCRTKLYNEPKEKSYQRIISILSSGVKHIFINGAGELFINRYLMKAFRGFSFNSYPNVRRFSVITNGTALNRTAWYTLSDDFRSALYSINVSIDSPKKETYEKIRVGGKFEVLIKNLEFISKLREEGSVKHLILTSVLQRLNIAELPKFVKYAICIKADHLNLNRIENWGHFDSDEFKNRIDLPENWEVTYKDEIAEAVHLMIENGVSWVSNTIKKIR
jgi:sulfatase maturation enzyme AslB (radical SAM superfamily)